MTAEEIQIPPTEIELSELMMIVRAALSGVKGYEKWTDILARLMFQRDVLAIQLKELKETIKLKQENQ